MDNAHSSIYIPVLHFLTISSIDVIIAEDPL